MGSGFHKFRGEYGTPSAIPSQASPTSTGTSSTLTTISRFSVASTATTNTAVATLAAGVVRNRRLASSFWITQTIDRKNASIAIPQRPGSAPDAF